MPYNTFPENQVSTVQYAVFHCKIYSLYPLLCVIIITIAGFFKHSIDFYYTYTHLNFDTLSVVVICAGSIGLFLISLYCCMSKQQHLRIMILFFIPMLLILQITAAIYGVVQMVDPKQFIKKSVSLNMANDFIMRNQDNEIKNNFDILQAELSCCGVYGPKDYGTNPLPKTCCFIESIEDTCKINKSYSTGCSAKVYEDIMYNISFYTSIMIILCILQIVAGVFVVRLLINYIR